MSLVVPDSGEIRLLDNLTFLFANALVMHLYKNDYTPVAASTLANFAEADFAGYAPASIENWLGALTVAGKAEATADEITFAHDGGMATNPIYGYYVTTALGDLLWAERDPNGPVQMANAAHQLRVTPKLSLASEF